MICLCGCGFNGKTRGLCPKTYQKYSVQVRRRETTWSKLVAEGKALRPKKKVRNTPQNWGYTGNYESNR
jgi:hypothetical protein